MPAVFAADGTSSAASKPVIYEHGTAYNKMCDRLENAAALYEKYAPVPRLAVYDIVFGASLKEFKKLNGCGVIMISAQCQDEKELPLSSVYIKSGGKRIGLKLLCVKKIEKTGDMSGRVFGKYRADAFYLLPYAYTQNDGELFLDWARGKEGHSLLKLPAELELDFAGAYKWNGKNPKDGPAMTSFLRREFSLGKEEAKEALVSLGISVKPTPTPDLEQI
jgi:hypothetical protein